MMIGPVFVDSSNIHSVSYEDNESVLTVTFKNGDSYEYQGVDKGLFQGLIHAASPGSYFHQNIKRSFNGEKV